MSRSIKQEPYVQHNAGAHASTKVFVYLKEARMFTFLEEASSVVVLYVLSISWMSCAFCSTRSCLFGNKAPGR